jgi:hypothetical protein
MKFFNVCFSDDFPKAGLFSVDKPVFYPEIISSSDEYLSGTGF